MLTFPDRLTCRKNLTYQAAFESARDHTDIVLLNQWTNTNLTITVTWLGRLNRSKNGPWFVIYAKGKDRIEREFRIFIKNPKRKEQRIELVEVIDKP